MQFHDRIHHLNLTYQLKYQLRNTVINDNFQIMLESWETDNILIQNIIIIIQAESTRDHVISCFSIPYPLS